jgi:hypothetical protein
MTGRLLLLVFCLFLPGALLRAQSDSVLYQPDRGMPDGVFLTYADFRNNNAILKEQILSEMDKNQLEFMAKVLFEPTFSFRRGDSVITCQSQSAWGFFQNKTLYVFYKDDFYRVPVFGSISYLVANVTIMNTGFYDSRFGTSSGAVASREIREFVINFYDGQVQEINNGAFENLIARDTELYQEYKKLSRRSQRDQLYKYIRRFNEKNPVYFLSKS